MQCVTADHFFNLLCINEIAYTRQFNHNDKFFSNAYILEKYKDDIYPSKVPQEPDEK